jgi:chromosome segregation ATPase
MDVEGILNQIRERVVSESANETKLSSTHSNGSAASANRDDALQRLRTYLAIAGRAADRLPPVISNRQGAGARLELWIKNKSKPLTRWFTWEQVNFNRAVNEALGDVVEILKGEAQELATLTRQLSQVQAETSGLLQQTNATVAQLRETADQTAQREAELAQNYARLNAEHLSLAAQYQSLLAEHTKLADQVIELAAQLRAEDRELKSQEDEEINRRLSQLAAELKEEQRVCFRQISLETGESAVLEDRARRALVARVEQLEEALKRR